MSVKAILNGKVIRFPPDLPEDESCNALKRIACDVKILGQQEELRGQSCNSESAHCLVLISKLLTVTGQLQAIILRRRGASHRRLL